MDYFTSKKKVILDTRISKPGKDPRGLLDVYPTSVGKEMLNLMVAKLDKLEGFKTNIARAYKTEVMLLNHNGKPAGAKLVICIRDLHEQEHLYGLTAKHIVNLLNNHVCRQGTIAAVVYIPTVDPETGQFVTLDDGSLICHKQIHIIDKAKIASQPSDPNQTVMGLDPAKPGGDESVVIDKDGVNVVNTVTGEVTKVKNTGKVVEPKAKKGKK